MPVILNLFLKISIWNFYFQIDTPPPQPHTHMLQLLHVINLDLCYYSLCTFHFAEHPNFEILIILI